MVEFELEQEAGRRYAMIQRAHKKPGTWAAKSCPAWCFTIFDVAERLDCTVRHARRLIKEYRIPTGLLVRPVRLADGRIVPRRLVTLTQSSLEALMLAHGGLQPRKDTRRRTAQ